MSSLKSRFKRNVLYQGSAEGDKKIDENREIFIDSIDSPSPLKILSLNIKIVDLIVHLQLASTIFISYFLPNSASLIDYSVL